MVAGLALALGAASTANADVIALWRFEPGSFLLDSSGNGHTLTNGAGSFDAASVTDVAGPQGGAGSALFDGTDVMFTSAALNLSSYRHLRFSWMQRHQATTSTVKVVFEQSSNYNSNNGAFIQTVNSDLGGSNSTTQGYFSERGASGNTSDLYTHGAGSDPGSWATYSVDVDLDASPVGNVVKIFDGNGTEIGTNRDTNPAAAAFINDVLYIGGRGTNAALGFVGNIDELKIESVPEPAIAALLGGALAVVALRRRRRA